MKRALTVPLLVMGLLTLAPVAVAAPAEGAKAPTTAKKPPAGETGRTALPAVIVHRDAGCGCCVKWADHLRKAGFPVDVRVSSDMEAIKDRLGVPRDARSCHTAEVGGYFVEGHVPAADVEKLLATRPKGRGIAVPGMPLGSPGMEMPGMAAQPFTVGLVDDTGRLRVFATH